MLSYCWQTQCAKLDCTVQRSLDGGKVAQGKMAWPLTTAKPAVTAAAATGDKLLGRALATTLLLEGIAHQRSGCKTGVLLIATTELLATSDSLPSEHDLLKSRRSKPWLPRKSFDCCRSLVFAEHLRRAAEQPCQTAYSDL